jgi:hypothetical protein
MLYRDYYAAYPPGAVHVSIAGRNWDPPVGNMKDWRVADGVRRKKKKKKKKKKSAVIVIVIL